MRWLFLTLSMSLGVLSGCASQPRGAPHMPLQRWIADYVRASERAVQASEHFSGFIGVARHGTWVAQQCVAPGEQAHSCNADTRFRVGSLTKQFTAVATLRLVDRGKLRLEDPVGKYVTGLSSEVAAVSLQHLLSHRSGIADFTENEALMSGALGPHTVERVKATFRDVPLAFRPGSTFAYSNSNYFLLAQVIDAVTGDYDVFVRSEVLDPAGLRNAGLGEPPASNSARGRTVDEAGALVAAPLGDAVLERGGGALYASANDLVAWDRALEARTLLSPAASGALVTPYPEAVPAELLRELPTFRGYAYGINIRCDHERVVHSHSGIVPGYFAHFARIPAEGWAVIVLANTDRYDTRALGNAIVQMLLESRPAQLGVSTERPCATR